MARSIPLIALSEMPEGRGRRVCTAGLDLALFRVGDTAYAIEDSCPHSGGSLSNGKLQGTRVACPVHGLKFDLERCASRGAPALEAKKYAVQVVDGMVMLTPDDLSTPIAQESP